MATTDRADPVDCDIALVGTGLAPLLAARGFVEQGKSVIVLNPDYDFFLENSELSLDPAPENRSSEGLDPQVIAEALRPHFPGALEYGTSPGYHDSGAPHLRARSALWIAARENWDDRFLQGAELGQQPQQIDGAAAIRKFPGVSARGLETLRDFRGLFLPKFWDLDVERYRVGVHEFVRERLGESRLLTRIAHLEWMPGGLRYYRGGAAYSTRVRGSVLVFWTPQLTAWVLSQAKHWSVVPRVPQGVRVDEHWTLFSREKLDPAVVGFWKNLVIWAECEGGQTESRRLSVLRKASDGGASADSFRELDSLTGEVLRWEKFTIASMKVRRVFEWGGAAHAWNLLSEGPQVRVVAGADGPVDRVVALAESVLKEFA